MKDSSKPKHMVKAPGLGHKERMSGLTILRPRVEERQEALAGKEETSEQKDLDRLLSRSDLVPQTAGYNNHKRRSG